MRFDMIIAGVGGQGILTISALIGRAALAKGWHLKQSEVHGMAQRGGAVQSHLRLSDRPIHSDLVPRGRARLILATEPLEALRYLPWLDPREGWLVANEEPVRTMDAYPDPSALYAAIRSLPRHFLFNADALARRLQAPRAANIAMLGAASPYLPFEPETLEAALAAQFARKGNAVVEANQAVFRAARQAALQAVPSPSAPP
jgi:indolepyruvate ferredoxin oxidoreductase beta subunit